MPERSSPKISFSSSVKGSPKEEKKRVISLFFCSMSRKTSSLLARQFLSTFDLNIKSLPSEKLHILDYPMGEKSFEKLQNSFKILCKEENISHVEMSSKIEDEPAATLVFVFLSDPTELSMKVNHLTTYTSSEHPIIWILVREKHHPRLGEKIPSIWEPLSNAQYFEVRPTIKIGQEKWIGTRFTVGRQGIHEFIEEKDIQMSLTLSSQAQQRRSSLL
jgi:hypothetical protein